MAPTPTPPVRRPSTLKPILSTAPSSHNPSIPKQTTARIPSTARQPASARGHSNPNSGWELLCRDALAPPASIIKYGMLDTPRVAYEVWRSTRTRIRVAYASRAGPRIDARFAVIRENCDDTGLTNALGKLCLMGTEANPEKDFLNALGNKLMSSGLKQYFPEEDFSDDVTALLFEASSVSGEGFLQMLPLYVEQILYPLIDDTSFTTEIYNVDGNGKEGGALFKAALDSEDDKDRIFKQAIRKAVFPEGSGYRYGPEGLSDVIRSLSLEEVRAAIPRPDELVIIIMGDAVNCHQILDVLSKQLEPLILSSKPAIPKIDPPRPYIDTPTGHDRKLFPAPIKKNCAPIRVTYAGDDNDPGEVRLVWLGPDPHDNVQANIQDALYAFWGYSDNALFQNGVIGPNSPVTLTDLSRLRCDPTLTIATFSGVPVDMLDTFAGRVMTALQSMAMSKPPLEPFQACLNKATIDTVESLEQTVISVNGLFNYFAHNILVGVSFGTDNGRSIPSTMQDFKVCDTLQTWTAEEWRKEFEDSFVRSFPLVVIGKPSSDVQQFAAREELREASVNRTRSNLAATDKKLRAALGAVNALVPPSTLIDYDAPDVTKIDWIEVTSAKSLGVPGVHLKDGPLQKLIAPDSPTPEEILPYCVQFDHVESNFIEISIFFSPEPLPSFIDKRCGVLIPMWLTGLFNTPVIHNGQEMSVDEVQQALGQVSVEYAAYTYGELVEIFMKVPHPNYEEAISWLRDILLHSVWSPDLILGAANAVAESINDFKTSATDIATDGYRNMLIGPHSLEYINNHLNTVKYMPIFMEVYKETPKKLVARMESLGELIVDNRDMRISVRGDIYSLAPQGSKEPPLAITAWYHNFITFKPVKKLTDLDPMTRTIDRETKKGSEMIGRRLRIYTVDALFNTSASFAAKAPLYPDDDDVPALMLAIEILNGPGGMLAHGVKNKGLCFDAALTLAIQSQVIELKLTKTPDVVEALNACGKIVRDLCDNVTLIDAALLVCARGSFAYNVAQDIADVSTAARASFMDQVLFGRPQFWKRVALENSQNVAPEDVINAMRTYIRPLFNPATSFGSVATAPLNGSKLKEAFIAAGYIDTQVEYIPPPGPRDRHPLLHRATQAVHDFSSALQHRLSPTAQPIFGGETASRFSNAFNGGLQRLRSSSLFSHIPGSVPISH